MLLLKLFCQILISDSLQLQPKSNDKRRQSLSTKPNHGWHIRAKPLIFVPCPFRNTFPIFLQLGTCYYYGNCLKLMSWMPCQCFISNFSIIQQERLLIIQFIPKLAIYYHFWQFVSHIKPTVSYLIKISI